MTTFFFCALVVVQAWEQPYKAWRTAPADGPLPKSAGVVLGAEDLEALKKAEPPLPFHSLTGGVRLADGTTWVGADGGVMLLSPGANRWKVFHSRRFLPDDRVTALAADGEGGVLVVTAQGSCRLYQEETTLARKMESIHTALRGHHMREGLVGDIQLNRPGDLSSGHVQHSSDNDGLWTSLYVAAEAFRYASTGDPQARANAWQSLEALMFLEEVTGLPGFAARSIVPPEGDPQARYGGEWHKSKDGRWWWKGDTSSDEVDGHYFAYQVVYDLASDEAEKKRIAAVVARITDRIMEHGYTYVGPSGRRTTWGMWAPEVLNFDLEWIEERGLNSLELLSHLKVAHHVTGDQKYHEAARKLIEVHAYAINTVEQKIVWPASSVNHSDDELAFVAYYPLVVLEEDPALRRIYLFSLERSFQIERPERSPLFAYIYAAGRQGSKRPEPGLVPRSDYDAEEMIEWFRDVPEDLYEWAVVNSKRHDLPRPAANRFGRMVSDVVLPASERRLMRWNGDPYQLDGGGNGASRDDGTYILLPYWMGRYHRLME
jgi:hypothetical protein